MMPKKPNILIIMSDQHNRRIMGCAGDPYVRTPSLDALASRGIRFTNSYCAAPLCVPSRMTFVTGQYPSDIGVWRNMSLLDPYVPTFAHNLSLAGYETILCGRMHFAGPEQHHGFARRLVGDMSGARDQSRPRFDNIPELDSGGRQNYPSVLNAGPGRNSNMAFDDDVFARAGRLLRQRDSAGGDTAGKPLCMVVGCMLPHAPFVCPSELYEEYMDRLRDVPIDDGDPATLHPAMLHWRKVRGIDNITPAAYRRARAAYYGLTTYVDQRIGEFLDTLAQTSFADNTAVLYTSDHGDMAGSHGIWWKDSFYEGSAGVPMIWSMPGRFQEGVVSNAVVSTLDATATFLSLGGAEPLPGARGRDLTVLLDTGRRPAGWVDRVFSENCAAKMGPARMIRDGQWKLIHYHGFDHPQMFDLEADPDERNDLGGSPQHAEIRRRLLGLVLEDWSGDDVLRRTAIREKQWNIILRWHDEIEVGESDVWQVPEGSNYWTPPKD